MEVFGLIANNLSGDRQKILDYLDTRREILNWYAVYYNFILIVSNDGIDTIRSIVHEQFPEMTFVTFTISHNSCDGWINEEVWNFINEPTSSGRWTS